MLGECSVEGADNPNCDNNRMMVSLTWVCACEILILICKSGRNEMEKGTLNRKIRMFYTATCFSHNLFTFHVHVLAPRTFFTAVYLFTVFQAVHSRKRRF